MEAPDAVGGALSRPRKDRGSGRVELGCTGADERRTRMHRREDEAERRRRPRRRDVIKVRLAAVGTQSRDAMARRRRSPGKGHISEAECGCRRGCRAGPHALWLLQSFVRAGGHGRAGGERGDGKDIRFLRT
jgi:hypothetical protein